MPEGRTPAAALWAGASPHLDSHHAGRVPAFVLANTDVNWLLTVGEKLLAGERLYLDLLD